MKKYTYVLVCCLAMLFTATAACAQQGGFTGQQEVPQQFGIGGFTGPSQIVGVSQAQNFPHKTPVTVRGNIVRAIGNDRYVFRDSSGEIVVRIKQKYWLGLSVGPTDTVEISGYVHKKDFQRPAELRAKYIRMATR